MANGLLVPVHRLAAAMIHNTEHRIQKTAAKCEQALQCMPVPVVQHTNKATRASCTWHVVCDVGCFRQHADIKQLSSVITDPSPSAMQDIDAPDSSQAGVTQPAVLLPRPTAKEAWLSQYQPSQAADQREGVMQGTDAPVTVLVSQRWL